MLRGDLLRNKKVLVIRYVQEKRGEMIAGSWSQKGALPSAD